MKIKQFAVVRLSGTSTYQFTKSYDVQADAEREAERLTAKEGQMFGVIQLISVVAPAFNVNWTR